MSESELLGKIAEGEIFGVVECGYFLLVSYKVIIQIF